MIAAWGTGQFRVAPFDAVSIERHRNDSGRLHARSLLVKKSAQEKERPGMIPGRLVRTSSGSALATTRDETDDARIRQHQRIGLGFGNIAYAAAIGRQPANPATASISSSVSNKGRSAWELMPCTCHGGSARDLGVQPLQRIGGVAPKRRSPGCGRIRSWRGHDADKSQAVVG